METKDNVLEIFLAISKQWPKKQRDDYLKKIRKDAINKINTK